MPKKEYGQNRDETGHDGSLIINGSNGAKEIAISNGSYEQSAEYAESRFNDSLHPEISLTGVSFSGSFEFDGSSEALRDALYESASDGTYQVPVSPSNVEIQFREEVDNGSGGTTTRILIFKNVGIETRSRDIPADDMTSTSYDFIAERMYKKSSKKSSK